MPNTKRAAEQQAVLQPRVFRETSTAGGMRPAHSKGIPAMTDEKREMLRHTVATIAYRGGKVLRNVPEGFAGFRIGETTRMPCQIVAHICDLFDWALSMARGAETWHDSSPLSWKEGADRFFAALRAFDDFLASEAPLATSTERLFQGPVADALTHIGQIALLRRLAASPVRGENYSRADIAVGNVGPEQHPPRREFD